ncbi:hypothetical protein J8281_15605 [Aquimarina sp. U1-2]|uniref:hypothetical protein n=1 Tax=Aquimarina sp. U1-2 TaxID=2823141 RepID=UPI001AECD35C|nr:hypothetical protein [Aquimarina sp. U1-2]MBP2833621.1 hypothetical protein [Aquimarina sp. U1-2]
MNLEEVIMASIAEFLDVEVHKDTETLDLSSKIEIVKKRIIEKIKNSPTSTFSKTGMLNYEYEIDHNNTVDAHRYDDMAISSDR